MESNAIVTVFTLWLLSTRGCIGVTGENSCSSCEICTEVLVEGVTYWRVVCSTNPLPLMPKNIHSAVLSASNIDLPSGLFDNVHVVESVLITGHVRSIKQGAFSVVSGFKDKTTIKFEADTVENIETGAFQNIYSINHLFLRYDVKRMAPGSFQNVYDLGKLEFADMPHVQFSSCLFTEVHHIDTVFIGGKVNSNRLPTFMFKGMHDIDKFEMTSSAHGHVEAQTFDGLRNVNTLHITATSLWFLDNYAFQGLTSVTNVGLWGVNITCQGEYACVGMTSVATITPEWNWPIKPISQASTPLGVTNGWVECSSPHIPVPETSPPSTSSCSSVGNPIVGTNTVTTTTTTPRVTTTTTTTTTTTSTTPSTNESPTPSPTMDSGNISGKKSVDDQHDPDVTSQPSTVETPVELPVEPDPGPVLFGGMSKIALLLLNYSLFS